MVGLKSATIKHVRIHKVEPEVSMICPYDILKLIFFKKTALKD